MDFLTCVEKLLECAIVVLGPQIGYLISYRNNIEMLKEKVEELKNEKVTKQRLINDARRNGETIVVEVQRWMSRVDEIIVRAQQFFEEERQANTGCSRTSCPNLCSRYQLSRRAKEMELEVDEILEKQEFDRISYLDFPQQMPDPIIGESNEGFESRMPTMNQIMEALRDPTVNMIGLCGLGGVGKTTIAREVEKKVKAEKIFDGVIFVTITDNLNIEKILGQIAKSLGMNLDQQTERMRYRLKERLKDQKNLLLIFDDLWEKLDLDIIGFPFDDDGKNNSSSKCRKILLTSRDKTLLSKEMKCKKTIDVNVLSNREALELFKRKAELHDDKNFPSEAYEIVQLCAGLPIRINAAAAALWNENDPNEWKNALHRLKNPLRRNITIIDQADSIFWVSYDKLDQELRPIFLLCAMLSHDPLIINLFMYSMGLDLLKGVQSMEEAEVELRALANKLKNKSLLLESDSNDNFIMHNVIRDVAQSIARDEWKAFVMRHGRLNEWPDKRQLEGYIRIYLDEVDLPLLPKELYGPRVQFFLLHMKDLDVYIPSTFFKSMQELKVLGLTNVRFSSLPSSLDLLEELRTLCLHSCVLEDIAEVGKLKDLKVLSLAHSIIKRLPYELGQLTCLEMLNLANCSNLEVIPANVLSNLKRLEILCMENSFNRWEAEGSSEGNENASLVELRHLRCLSCLDIHIPNASVLPKDLFSETCLERYKIFIGEDWEWSGKYETSKTLKLKLKSGILWECGIQKLLERVEDLYLDDVSGITNVLNDLHGNGFPLLKHLLIQNNDQIEYVVNNLAHSVGAFPCLETLNLLNLSGLKKLCQGSITTAFFQSLRVFRVRNCDQVKSILSISMVKCLCQLIEIEIVECKSIQGIVVTTSRDTSEQNLATDVLTFDQLRTLTMSRLSALTDFYFNENATDRESNAISGSLFSNKVSFPKLEILKLSLNNLVPSIWDDRLPHSSFSNLKELIVKNCGSIVKLVPLHVLKSLSRLEELVVCDCELLEMVFDFEELNSYQETQSLQLVVPLKVLMLWRLPKLQHVWSNDPQGIVSFQNLRQVSFPKLEMLKLSFLNSLVPSIWDDRLPHSSFSNLKELIVENCGSIVKLVPLHVLKSLSRLEEVHVRDCELLEMVFDFEELNSYQETQSLQLFVPLKELRLCGLPKLQHVWSNDPQGIVSFPNLRQVDAYNCKSLTSMFPASIAKDMRHLEKLQLYECGIEVIVAKDEVSESGAPTFVFPRLSSLCLAYLPNLRNFYPYRHTSEWPRLQELDIGNCDELKIFENEVSSSSAIQEEEIPDSKYPLFFHKKVNPNLEVLKLWDEEAAVMIWNGQLPAYHFHRVKQLHLSLDDDNAATFPYGLLKRFPNLEELSVGGSIQEIFSCKEPLGDDARQLAPFRKLKLFMLRKMKHLWNEHSPLDILQSLETLHLDYCSDLINLGPSFISLGNLTDIYVDGCNGLTNLLTSSTAGSLMHLTRLTIKGCKRIEEIITKQGEDVEKEIIFNKLGYLKLHGLPSLKSFCSHNYIFRFPLLDEVIITECPRLKMFCPGVIHTPSLKRRGSGGRSKVLGDQS